MSSRRRKEINTLEIKSEKVATVVVKQEEKEREEDSRPGSPTNIELSSKPNIRNQNEMSEYERKRLENIARNNQYLTQLGFSTSSNNRKRASSSLPIRNSKKRSKPHETDQHDQLLPTRRSSRVATLPPKNYKEVRHSASF
jgi:hypothetical protein